MRILSKINTELINVQGCIFQNRILHVEENWVTLIFMRPATKKDWSEQDTEQVTEQGNKLIQVLRQKPLTSVEIMLLLGLSHRPTFLYNYLQPSLDIDLIEMTIPDKPTSRHQKYRLTKKGKYLVNSK